MKLQGNVLTHSGEFALATIDINNDKINAVEIEGPAQSSVQWIVPGFIDQHCHGGGGGAFDSADAVQIQRAIDFHRSAGTTSIVGSLVSAGPQALLDQIAALVPFVRSGELAGIHLEGPWINLLKKGAHDPDAMRPLTASELDQVIQVAGGALSLVTVAPEIDGVLESIPVFTAAGATVALGHTYATFDQTIAGINAGATAATHLFNAMPPLEHRNPGPIGAFVSSPNVFVELIADLEHVHPAVLQFAVRAVGPERSILISDSMCAAGCSPGIYHLGKLEVQVDDHAARLVNTDVLAGSVLTLHKALRNVVNHKVADLAQAAVMASTTPAHALGLANVGLIQAGFDADLVILDHDLSVNTVIRKGERHDQG